MLGVQGSWGEGFRIRVALSRAREYGGYEKLCITLGTV